MAIEINTLFGGEVAGLVNRVEELEVSKTFEGRAALVATTGLAVGDVVFLRGVAFETDGRAGHFVIRPAATGTHDNWTIIDVANGDSAVQAHRVMQKGDANAAHFGFGVSASGSVNAASLLRAWNKLVADNGGVLEIPGNTEGAFYDCDKVVFPRTSVDIVVQGVGRAYIRKTAQSVNDYIWDFADDGFAINIEIRNIFLNGSERSIKGHGIRVGKSNQLQMINCKAKKFDGCAFQIGAPNNATLDLVTFECGSIADGRFAQEIVPIPVAGESVDDDFPNDVRYRGTTERDELGLLVEECIMFRTMDRIKLHGMPTNGGYPLLNKHMLCLSSCRSFDVSVIGSMGWNDQAILITDTPASDVAPVAGPVDGTHTFTAVGIPAQYPILRSTQETTSGHIDVQNFWNTRRATLGDETETSTSGYITLHLGNNDSQVSITSDAGLTKPSPIDVKTNANPAVDVPDSSYYAVAVHVVSGATPSVDLGGLQFMPDWPADKRVYNPASIVTKLVSAI